MTDPTGFLYAVFGLRLQSEIALPELHQAQGAAAADVRIRLGATPRVPDEKPGYNVTEGGTLLNVPDGGRYWISGGSEILVERVPEASERNMRLYLLGSALGALLHQRGLLPLHANVIEIDGRAIAFMGHSGAGKSTMAAWFNDRGFRVLADDVCVVTFDESGRAFAHGGIPRLRLWREALEASGRSTVDFELSFDDMDKYNVPTPPRPGADAVPLDHLYLLARAEGDRPAMEIRLLKGVEAVNALVANTYRGGYVGLTGQTGRHLQACLTLVRTAPVFSAERMWGFDALDRQGRQLEEHARAVMRGAEQRL